MVVNEGLMKLMYTAAKSLKINLKYVADLIF